MATKRKTTAARKVSKSSKKPAAKPAKKVVATGAKSAAKSAKSARPVAKKVVAKAAAAKPAAKPVAAKPPAKVVGRPAVAGKMKVAAPVKAASKKLPAKPKPVVRRSVAPDPRVRPLGVLPPESRARVVERPLPVPVKVVKARPNPRKPVEPVRIQGAQRLTDKDMKEFEGRLMAERQRIMKEMGHLENTVLKVNQRDSSGDLSGYSFHMADAGTDAIEREKAFMFASVEGRMLLEINEALRRLYRGEYGVCESCGKPIARARLEAMPYARLCVSCKELEERASRGAQ